MQVENEHFVKKKCYALKHVRNKEQHLPEDRTQFHALFTNWALELTNEGKTPVPEYTFREQCPSE